MREQFASLGMDAAEISAERLDKRLGDLEAKAAKLPHFLKDDEMHRSHIELKGDELISMHRMCTDFTTRAADQLKSRLFLAIPSEDKEFFVQSRPPFGQVVADKFPSLAYDVSETGKCLALGRSTASAFHSIRCLEASIRAVARCLGIPDPITGGDRNWNNMLTKIKKELDRRWPTTADRMLGDGQFFEDSYAALAAMRNPWRNATMHLDQVYTEQDAKDLFNVVGAFMRRLSERIDENGDPKA